MKYDEKNGNPIPENRSDEVQLTLQKLNNLQKETKGMNDKNIEYRQLLADINVSCGLMVDILGAIYNHLKQSDAVEEEVTGDAVSDIPADN